MITITTGEAQPSALLKEHLASGLKRAIMSGGLRPGERVVEGKWAKEFSVAQASVREAINLLIAEGFLVKDAGRSARVVNYREPDVSYIYEVRAAIEGLAAELSCAKATDLSRVESALDRMVEATAQRDMPALIQSDLDFHIALIEAAGNPLVADIGRKLLFPLFAFIQIRVVNSGQGPEAWSNDLLYHRGILQVIREGNPSLACQFVQHCLRQFAVSAYAVWENVGGSVEEHHKLQESRQGKGKKLK